MAFEPGGYADKLGNRHEGRWVVKQLLRLLNEQVRSVTVEAIGDDEKGVDLILELDSGIRQFQQCKARNAGRDCWTLGTLNSRGILEAMKFQLDRNECNEFALVTAVSGAVFNDICESARKSPGDPELYYKYQIQEIGQDRRKAFHQFCEHLGLNEEAISDRARAFGYLRRMHIVLWPDDQNSLGELSDLASVLVSGKAATVIACLAQFAEDNIRKCLTANDVWNHLQESRFNPRQLAHDNRTIPALEKLQQRFEDSIAPMLIGHELIKRQETQQLLEALGGHEIVILHGSPGCGKSGVLYELTGMLNREGVPLLPVRLDRQYPENTTKEFGVKLGLPESPVLCLSSQAGEKTPVLILDQLDALRWTSSHAADSLDVCKDLVREALGLWSGGKPISVVLSCRTFDLEHDPQINNWLKDQTPERTGCAKIEVKCLSDEVIQKVVTQAGGNFGEFTPRQKEILASPQHLAMWSTIAFGGNTSSFQSSTELMRCFWDDRYRELVKAGFAESEADEVIDTLVDYMERKGQLSAPGSLVAKRQKTTHELQTLGLIRTSENQITFCHQSYLDFRVADRLLRRIHQGACTVKEWLGSKDRQSLFRREQLRQVLVLLSDDSPADFLAAVRELLGSDSVRFHLKHLVLEVLAGISEPGQQLCEYLLSLWSEEYWRPHINDTVFAGQPQYMQFLIERYNRKLWMACMKRAAYPF